MGFPTKIYPVEVLNLNEVEWTWMNLNELESSVHKLNWLEDSPMWHCDSQYCNIIGLFTISHRESCEMLTYYEERVMFGVWISIHVELGHRYPVCARMGVYCEWHCRAHSWNVEAVRLTRMGFLYEEGFDFPGYICQFLSGLVSQLLYLLWSLV